PASACSSPGMMLPVPCIYTSGSWPWVSVMAWPCSSCRLKWTVAMRRSAMSMASFPGRCPHGGARAPLRATRDNPRARPAAILRRRRAIATPRRGHPVHGPYHEHEYGFPQREEAALFERLLLEINQAGLSWETILKKREGFRRAYHGFDVDTVAGYGEADVARLLADPGIIRNRLK